MLNAAFPAVGDFDLRGFRGPLFSGNALIAPNGKSSVSIIAWSDCRLDKTRYRHTYQRMRTRCYVQTQRFVEWNARERNTRLKDCRYLSLCIAVHICIYIYIYTHPSIELLCLDVRLMIPVRHTTPRTPRLFATCTRSQPAMLHATKSACACATFIFRLRPGLCIRQMPVVYTHMHPSIYIYILYVSHVSYTPRRRVHVETRSFMISLSTFCFMLALAWIYHPRLSIENLPCIPPFDPPPPLPPPLPPSPPSPPRRFHPDRSRNRCDVPAVAYPAPA